MDAVGAWWFQSPAARRAGEARSTDSAQIGPAAAKRRDVQWPNRFHNAGGRPHQEHGPGPLEPIPTNE